MIDGNTTSYSMKGIKANARIRVEQDIDLVLNNLTLKILGQSLDQVPITTNPQYKHYKANEGRINPKDGLKVRKYFEKTGYVNCHQFVIPNQLVIELLWNLHGEFGKHLVNSKTIISYRERKHSQK